MDGYGGFHPEWGNPITKEHTWRALTDKLILDQKTRSLEYPRYNSQTTWNSWKRKTIVWTHQSILEGLNKALMEGVTELQCGVETDEMTIQRLTHLGIHPIYNHQAQTLLWRPTRACWQEPDISVSWEALPVPDKYRGGCSQPSIGLSTGSPMKELEKVSKEPKGFAAP